MSLLDKIKSLFGKGELKFRVQFDDGQTATAVIEYVGCPDDVELMLAKARDRIEFQTDRVVRHIALAGVSPR
jgi:hypothetical protein